MRLRTAIQTVAIVSILGLALTGCGAQPPSLERVNGVDRIVVNPQQAKDSVQKLAQAALALGLKLAAGAGENAVVSPASALIALGMLREGASKDVAQEMDSVLGWGPERQQAIGAVLTELQKYDGDPGSVDKANPPEKPVLKVSNGVFVAKDAPIGGDFLTALAKIYDTGVYRVDFSGDANDKINAWVKQSTGGLIEKAPIESMPGTNLSLLSALFFAGQWEAPFKTEATSPRPFHSAKGAVDVPTMHATKGLAYAEGPGWQAVDLPYAQGFSMRLYLPASGDKPLADAAQMSAVATALGSAAKQSIALGLPSWDKTTNLDLMEPLRKLGLVKTIDGVGGFNGILPGAMITGAAQTAVVKVAEKGTVAAAVTQVNVQTSAEMMEGTPRELNFDRPFSYQIIDQQTGLPLFLGVVDNPKS